MKSAKKVAVAVACLVIVVGVGTYLVRKFTGHRPPGWVLDQPLEKIDSETLELITLTHRQWQKLGTKDGKYKNPKTGRYTMVTPMICASCGEKIPEPPYPTPAEREKLGMDEMLDRIEQLERSYKCPKCGKRACAGMSIP